MSRNAAAATAANEQGRAWQHAWLLVIGTLVAIVAGSGCGGGPSNPPSTTTANGVQLPPAEVHLLLSEASNYQQDILRDSFVSLDEYQRAALAFVQCAQGAGVTFTAEPKESAIGRFTFQTRYADQEQKASYDACYTKYFKEVDMAWAAYVAPRQSEILQGARDDLGDCLRAAGIDIPKHPSSADFKEYMTNPTAAFARCAQSVQQTDNLPAFVG